MSSYNWPPTGGSSYWNDAVANVASLPPSAVTNSCTFVVDVQDIYQWTGSAWVAITQNTADVAGPGSSTDNALARFDGTTGKTIQNSAVTVDDSGNLSTTGTLNGVTATEMGYVSGVTSSIQTQLGTKLTDPMTTRGDIIREGAGGPERYALGAANTYLKSDGTDVVYATPQASEVALPQVGSPTYTTVDDDIKLFHSPGVFTGGGITDNLNGTIDVAAGTGKIRTTDSEIGALVFMDWSGTSGTALTDNSNNWVYVDYNAGSPQIAVATSKPSQLNTNVVLATIYREGTTLHINEAYRYEVGDHALKMLERAISLDPIAHESGAYISETGTRNFALTAGAFWTGFVRFTTAAFDSSVADTFTYFYRDGVGGWTEVASQSQINNTQYDNGTGTLATLSNNKYGVHWVYLENDGDVSVLYGQGDYTLTEAQETEPPTSVPGRLQNQHADLAGRIIILKSAAAFTEVLSAYNGVFLGGTASDHNVLTNLQGGAANEYYHLTSTQHAGLTGLTASRAVASDGSGNLTSSATTSTELGYVNGVTSAIQTQLDGIRAVKGNVSVSSDVTLTDARMHFVDTTAARSLALPAAAAGLYLVVKDVSGSAQTNNITLTTPGAETIDGGATYVMDSNYASVAIYSDGTNYFVS